MNIVGDMMCYCMSVRKGKKKKIKGAVDDRGFVIMTSVVLRNYIPGEVYYLSFYHC